MKEEQGWNRYITELTDLPMLNSEWEKDMVHEITSRIAKDQIERVLEVGCSNGRWVRWFCREYRCEGHGVDMNSVGFRKRDLNFMVGDAFRLSYRNNVFDVVFSLGFIEHFRKHVQRFLLLKEQMRVLRSKGFLVCEVPNFVFLQVMKMKYFHFRRRTVDFFSVTEKELEGSFEALRLTVVSSRFLGWFFEMFKVPRLFDRKFVANNYFIVGVKK